VKKVIAWRLVRCWGFRLSRPLLHFQHVPTGIEDQHRFCDLPAKLADESLEFYLIVRCSVALEYVRRAKAHGSDYATTRHAEQLGDDRSHSGLVDQIEKAHAYDIVERPIGKAQFPRVAIFEFVWEAFARGQLEHLITRVDADHRMQAKLVIHRQKPAGAYRHVEHAAACPFQHAAYDGVLLMPSQLFHALGFIAGSHLSTVLPRGSIRKQSHGTLH